MHTTQFKHVLLINLNLYSKRNSSYDKKSLHKAMNIRYDEPLHWFKEKISN
mgnify:CR=1 FL=1